MAVHDALVVVLEEMRASGEVIITSITAPVYINKVLDGGRWADADKQLVLQTIHWFSQSCRRPLLGPSPGGKRLLALSHLRHY